jgi:hypothetical protein
MGSIVTLTTIPQKVQTKEYSLCIGWERYEQAELVDDIELEIVKKKRGNKNDPTTIKRNDFKRITDAYTK